MTEVILAIDNGTTSTRAIAFSQNGLPLATHQVSTTQHFPFPGGVEHDALEIWDNVRECIRSVREQLGNAQVRAVGITNQRETVVLWKKSTGIPIHPALVWQDVRTQNDVDAFVSEHLNSDAQRNWITDLTGLPVTAYFSASKIAWMLDNVEGARELATRGDLLMGTIDSWLAWNLTGGVAGGAHVTDVTNASRTLLMNLETLSWDDRLLDVFAIPRNILPEIKPSVGVFAECVDELRGVPLSGILGDQHAATFGQGAFEAGKAKNTYGTGNFLMCNTGVEVVRSSHGLISTVAYQIHGQPPVYALEGSVAVSGSLIQWLRDNLGIISSASEVERLAASVSDSGDCYVVPAFSGLFAPHWRSDARGVIVGLTRFITRAHIARAALEAVAFQTCEVVTAMMADTGAALTELRVDGGMVVNELLMQEQADLLGIDVVRARVVETTALGAAFAAGLAVGYWGNLDDLRALWQEDARWHAQIDASMRDQRQARWSQAIERSLNRV
jgi:glycerol kinase